MFVVIHCLVACLNWLIQMGVSGCSLSGCLSKLAERAEIGCVFFSFMFVEMSKKHTKYI